MMNDDLKREPAGADAALFIILHSAFIIRFPLSGFRARDFIDHLNRS